MKIAKKVILILVVVTVLAGAGWILYMAYTMPPEEATALIEKVKVYAMERVVPIAVSVMGAVSLIISVLVPVAKRVKESACRFDAATESVQGTESASRRAVAEMQAWKEQMAADQARAIADMKLTSERSITAMEAEMARCVALMNADHETVEKTGRDARRMLEMMEAGLCNLPDVVASGAGVKIRRLAEQARADVAPMQRIEEAAQEAEDAEGQT